ncbi:ankyrin repeat-containing domain protein [Aspergillus navahoensis]
MRRQARVDVVRYLLQRGADVDHVTRYGEMAVYLAAQRRGGYIVRELLRWLPRLFQRTNRDQMTVLHVAAAHCLLAVIKMLIEAGVDIYTCDQKGLSVLQYIRKARWMETVEWITRQYYTGDSY